MQPTAKSQAPSVSSTRYGPSVEVAGSVVPRLLEQLDEEEGLLESLRAETQILVGTTDLLGVEVDVEQLAGIDRLGDSMVDVERRPSSRGRRSGLTPTISGWSSVEMNAKA